MQVKAYIIAYNDEDIIAQVIRHYRKLANDIVILDNYSTDNTKRIAEQNGAKVLPWGNPAFHDDTMLLQIKSLCWRQDKDLYDWIIIVDSDEILNMTWVQLMDQQSEGVTAIKGVGFNMHSYDMPKHLMTEIKNGIPAVQYNKLVCFNPEAITDLGFTHGCHTANPQGYVKYNTREYELLHYKFIGPPERTIKKHNHYSKRSSQRNIANGWGSHYHGDQSYLIAKWPEWIAASRRIIE